MAILKIHHILDIQADLELAVLVGSRVDGCAHSESDWDIATQWKRELSMLENLANTETLRNNLAVALGIEDNEIDLIDLPHAGFAMCAVVAEGWCTPERGGQLGMESFSRPGMA